MPGSGFLLNAEDARRAVNGYADAASTATQTLKTMQSQVDELMTKYAGKQAATLRNVADDLKLRIDQQIGRVNELSRLVRESAQQYDISDDEIAQSFNTAVNTGGGAVYGKLTA